MLAFKPIEEPFLKKLFKSGVFQFLLVVLLGVGVSFLVIKTDQQQQWFQKINRFASVGISSSKNVPTPAETTAAEALERNLAPPPISATLTNSENTFAATARTITTSQTAITSAVISVEMMEIETEYANSLIQQAQEANPLLMDSEIKAGILINSIVLSSQHFKKLKSENIAPIDGNYFLWTGLAGQNESENRGLNLKFQIEKSASAPIKLKFIFVKLHPNDPIQIPLETSLKKGEKLILIGNNLLSYLEFETDLANIPPFQIFKSPDFKSQRTTFALTVEVKD